MKFVLGLAAGAALTAAALKAFQDPEVQSQLADLKDQLGKLVQEYGDKAKSTAQSTAQSAAKDATA